MFKEVYGDGPIKVVPDVAKLVKMIPFSEAEKLGDSFHVPVVLTHEGGVSYAASGDGAFNLLTAVAMTSKDAQVDGSQMLIRGNADYEVLSKAAQGGAKAFRAATSTLVENLTESINKRLEIALLYGKKELGVADSSVNASSTTTTVTFTAASWADGIWAGSEGHQVCFHDSAFTNLVSSGADAVFTVTSVDNDNRAIVFTGTSTGITALDSDLSGADQYVTFLGASGPNSSGHPPATHGFKDCAGLDKIITNTGTLFNISASTYNLWKGNSYSVGSGPLTLAKILSGLALPQARAGLDEPVTLICNPVTWNNICSDQASLRRYGAERGKGENGFEAIMFHSASGPIEVIGHSIVKRGEAFAFPKKRLKRIGAQEVSFKTPGRSEEIFHHLENVAAVELRAYSHQALFCEQPAKLVKFTGIVNA
jgi:hypothetical protein